jgi:hypothetical protein
VYAGAVGLVKGGLEDDVCAQSAVDADQLLGYGVEQFGRLYDAGTGDEGRHGVVCCYHVVVLQLFWAAKLLILFETGKDKTTKRASIAKKSA